MTGLRSRAVFRKLGSATQKDMAVGKLDVWYNSQHGQEMSMNYDTQTQNQSNKGISVFEVATMDVAQQMIKSFQGDCVEKEEQKDDNNENDSTLNRLKLMYGNTVQRLLTIQPVEDQDYKPKTSNEQQIGQNQPETGQQSTTPQSSLKVAGLRQPPPRRIPGAVKNVTKGDKTKKKSEEKQTPAPLFPSSLLDNDTLQYLQERRLEEQYQYSLHQAPNIDQNVENGASNNEPNNENDDIYDIYECYIPSETDTTDPFLDIHMDSDATVVVPRSELEYILAIDQIDNSLAYQSIHDEFVSQFSKPRLSLRHQLLHSINDSYHQNGNAGSRRGGKKVKFGTEYDVDELENGVLDDDHHPDFDSDMDYPDSDDDIDKDDEGNRDGGEESDGNDEEEECFFDRYDQEDDYNYSDDDTFKYSDHDDDDEDDDQNQQFRYGGVKGGNLDQNNQTFAQNFSTFAQNHTILKSSTAHLSLTDDSDDPILRELIHAQKQQQKMNLKKGNMAINREYRLAGQEDELYGYNDISPGDSNGFVQNEPFVIHQTDLSSFNKEHNKTKAKNHTPRTIITNTEINNAMDNNNNSMNDQNNAPNDPAGQDDKINRSVFNLLFGDDYQGSDDDNDDYNDGYSGNMSQDEEDPYGGTNTFYQIKTRKQVYDEQQ
jgi:hypothetical protein